MSSKWPFMVIDSMLTYNTFGLNIMRPEEILVLRVLRFAVVMALAAALLYMAYKG